jgi:WhiB family redox-sensing transcriptional regulator
MAEMAEMAGRVRSAFSVVDWRLLSACRVRDTAQFFGAVGEDGVATRGRQQRAKALCRRCPVRAQCAAHALSHREPYGVWGGFTRRERVRLLELGWEDLADERRTRVQIAGLERRLSESTAR